MPDNTFTALKTRMKDAKLVGTPGWKIVLAAGLQPPNGDALYGDSDQIALVKLMKSFHKYGQQKWTWVPQAGAGNSALVRGDSSAAYCELFNNNFAFLAAKAFGLTGFKQGKYEGQFITFPSKNCIDSKWKGNVSTLTKKAAQLNIYKFSAHFWVTWGGAQLDVCFNRAFPGASAVVMSSLTPAAAGLLKSTGYKPDELYKLTKAHAEGNHLVMVKPTTGKTWPQWMIVPEAKIPHKK